MDIKTGRFTDMPNSIYHKSEGYSKSSLDLIDKSMSHYFEYKTNPPEPTASLDFGAAFHCRVLTPNLYQAEYVIAPIVDKRTKAGKDAYEMFCSESKGKTVINAEDAGIIEKMAESILSHPVASKMLVDGDAENSFFWQDKSGLQCKCRPDYLRRDGVIIDLKTTNDASYFEFQRSIINYRYHVQAAFYIDGIHSVTRSLPHSFTLIAVEKKAPYAVAIYTLDSFAVEVGRTAYRIDIDKIIQYEKDKTWAGYPLRIQEMILPNWAA